MSSLLRERWWALALPQAIAIGTFVAALVILVIPVPIALRATAALVAGLLLGDAAGRAIVPSQLGVGGRLMLSLSVTLALPVMVALVLTVSPFGIGRLQLVVAAALIGGGAWTIIMRRGAAIAPTFAPLTNVGRLARPAILYIATVILVGVAFTMRLSGPTPGDTPLTVLSVGPGSAGDGRIGAEVSNNEGKIEQYRLELQLDGRLVESRMFALPDDGQWNYTSNTVVEAGQRVEIRLFRSPDLTMPYRVVTATVGVGW